MATGLSPELLTPGETAELLNIAEQTLALWRSSGRYSLPYRQVGRSIRYERSEVLAWLNTRKATHTGELAAVAS